MKLGFVSAILPDLSLEEVVRFASSEGFACVELMCWPVGRAERRYAGVTYVDVEEFDRAAAERVTEIMQTAGVAVSGLGYYPNPLAPDRSEAEVCVEVEDRAYEPELELRKRALRQSRSFLSQHVVGSEKRGG